MDYSTDQSTEREEDDDENVESRLWGVFTGTDKSRNLKSLATLVPEIMAAESDVWYRCVERIQGYVVEMKDRELIQVFIGLFKVSDDKVGHERLMHAISTANTDNLGRISERNAKKDPARLICSTLIHTNPDLASKISENGDTALHLAARRNDFIILSNLLETLKAHGHLPNSLYRKNTYRGSKKTPLECAILHGYEKSVEVLINADDNIENCTNLLTYTIDCKQENVFLKIFQNNGRLILVDRNVLRRIIEESYYNAWKAVVDFLVNCDDNETKKPFDNAQEVLHIAVKVGDDEIVRQIMELQPELAVKELSIDGKKCSTLDLNSPKATDPLDMKHRRENIRKVLVPAFVNHYTVVELKRMFLAAKLQLNSISLDLKKFSGRGYHFFPLIDAMTGKQNDGREPMLVSRKFESSVRVVELPNFSQFSPQGPWHTDLHIQDQIIDAVTQLFSWLRNDMHVKNIVRLVIPDSFYIPIPEYVIERAAADFNIQVLDWKRPDLSIDAIRCIAGQSIREINLYSSGNPAVLKHWLSPEGFQSLPTLRKVNLSICTANIDGVKWDQLIELVRDKYQEIHRSFPERFDLPEPERLEWDSRRMSMKRINMAQQDEPPFEFYGFEGFRRAYASFQWHREANKTLPLPDRVKVAIIDNGVDGNSLDRPAADGISFVDEGDSEFDWSIATHPHGTQMAYCVRHFDPFCELYVAKVANEQEDFNSGRVINAIEWAIQKEVDIISLSLTFPDKTAELYDLKRKVAEAVETHKILVFCSTGDGDKRSDKFWPAGCPGSVSVTTKDRGLPQDNGTSDADAKYMLDVPVLAIEDIAYRDFHREGLKAQGSSVATACVSGLASMILSCGRAVKSPSVKTRQSFVEHHLNSMISLRTKRLLEPSRYGGQKVPENPEEQEFLDYIHKHFVE